MTLFCDVNMLRLRFLSTCNLMEFISLSRNNIICINIFSVDTSDNPNDTGSIIIKKYIEFLLVALQDLKTWNILESLVKYPTYNLNIFEY